MIPENVDLYIGAPIEEQSEREVLLTLLPLLAKRGVRTFVFANVHIGGRQLDLVIGSSDLTLLVEVKGATRPIAGTQNGAWTVRTRGGRIKPARNAYRQALDAKNLLADAMRAFDQTSASYPNACVLFTPSVPDGSDIPSSDFKLALGGVSSLAALLSGTSELCWTAEKWLQYAQDINLIRIEMVEAAFDDKLLNAYSSLDRYARAFTATYGPPAGKHVQDLYRFDGKECGFSGLYEAICGQGADLLIKGPSGCGKSLLALSLAVQLLAAGMIPIVVECKSFDGQLRSALDREVRLLDFPSASVLLQTARRLSRPIALIVDGYNECSQSSRLILTRALRAASARYGAAIIISSSTAIERGDLLNLRSAEVPAPSAALKAAIAGIDPAAEAAIAVMLEIVSTGFEADLVGQIGREISPDSSRFAILDYFVRCKLGDRSIDGIRLFCAVAERLTERIAFSLSVRELDRLLSEQGLAHLALDAKRYQGVITVKGDRVSFGHEIFLHAFSAEAFLRSLGGDLSGLKKVLSQPRYSSLRIPLLGAIDDEALALELVQWSSDEELLCACLRGECGGFARQAVLSELDALPAKLESEAGNLRFIVTADGGWNVELDPACRLAWTEHDRAILWVLASELSQGRRTKTYLPLIALVDRQLQDEFRRLRPIALEKKVGIRTGMFAVTYLFGGQQIGITYPVATLHNGAFLFRQSTAEIPEPCMAELWDEASTPGQIYFALAVSRRMYELKTRFLPHVLPLLHLDRWKFLPYHLQLELLQFVHFLNDVPEELQPELVDALEKLLPELSPLLTGDVIEVLGRLGTLGDEESRMEESVREEIGAVIAEPSSEASQVRAWSIYSAQFDHPFSTTYWEAIEELSEEERFTLYKMACFGAADWQFFVSTLLDKLADTGDMRAAVPIVRWTALPVSKTSMPQIQIETFVSAYIALGRLKADLPLDARRLDRSDAENSLTACGVLYFWLEQLEPAQVLNVPAAKAAMDYLVRAESRAAAGVLFEISNSMHDSRGRGKALVHAFPSQVLAICRATLNSPSEQSGYFENLVHLREEPIKTFAIQVIERFGTRLDLPLLRALVAQPKLSQRALEAVRTIELRGEASDREL